VWTVAAVLLSCAVAVFLGVSGSAGLMSAAAAAALVLVVAWRAFGGITGDVLGAVEQAAELAVVATAASLVESNNWLWP